MLRRGPFKVGAGQVGIAQGCAVNDRCRTLRAEVDELKIDVAELKRASGK